MIQPAELFVRTQAEWLRTEKQDALGFRAPIGRNGVVKLRRAFADSIKDATPRHQFAGGEKLHFDSSARKRGNAISKHLRRHAGARQILWPCGDHFPLLHTLCDGGCCQRHSGSPDDTGFNKFPSFHCRHSFLTDWGLPSSPSSAAPDALGIRISKMSVIVV